MLETFCALNKVRISQQEANADVSYTTSYKKANKHSSEWIIQYFWSHSAKTEVSPMFRVHKRNENGEVMQWIIGSTVIWGFLWPHQEIITL